MAKHFGKRELRRIPHRGKIAGVCAGLAEYLGFETWVVRLVVLGAAIWSGLFPALFFYILAAFLLDEADDQENVSSSYAYEGGEKKNDRERHKISAREVWKTAPSVDSQVEKLRAKFSVLEKQVRQVESCVTTQEFQLRRQFKEL